MSNVDLYESKVGDKVILIGEISGYYDDGDVGVWGRQVKIGTRGHGKFNRVDVRKLDLVSPNVYADWLEDHGEPEAAKKLRAAFPIDSGEIEKDVPHYSSTIPPEDATDS